MNNGQEGSIRAIMVAIISTYLVFASTCTATQSFTVPTAASSPFRACPPVHGSTRTAPHRCRIAQRSFGPLYLEEPSTSTSSTSTKSNNNNDAPVNSLDSSISNGTPKTTQDAEYFPSLRGGDAVQRTPKSNYSILSFKSLTLTTLLLVEFTSRITDHVNFALSTQLFSIPFWSSIAPFASIALKMSPLPTILTVRKQKSVGGLPLLPYNAMATLTFVLVAYGITKGDWKIILAHGVGHILSLFYCISYLQNSPPSATNLPGTAEQHKLVSFSLISFVLAAMAFLEPTTASTVVGWTSVALSMIMYVGPLTRLRSAIAAKSARDIPLPFAIVGLVNAIAWFVYGFLVKGDVVLYAPCLIGLLSTSGQIGVNFLYGNGTKDEKVTT